MKYYSKHKDDSPAQTVLNIQKILHDAGLFPVMEWTETKDIKLSVSCRVTLYPTKLGANGMAAGNPARISRAVCHI
ncbi:MAG: hypothetical protein IJP56_09030 [Synergistaceae bacterium]|nr:hypothetical protein [Synergistaceae bacterium]